MKSAFFRRGLAVLLAFSAAVSVSVADAQRPRETPYWASISAGRAMMRTGPGRNFPATWLYVRPDLPIQVLEVYQTWRKIRDPDGTIGWMMVQLLSDTRTAIVRGDSPVPMHENPDPASPIRFRAEPNVVGRISRCGDGWCFFDVDGHNGYVRVDRLWGVDPRESVR